MTDARLRYAVTVLVISIVAGFVFGVSMVTP